MYNKNGKVYVEWSDVEQYVDELIFKLRADYFSLDSKLFLTGIYGVPRGGLIIATLLSYKLNLPLLMAPAQGCLIVDDIADSGRTLIHFREKDTQFNKYYISTMFYHERSIVKPDFYKFNKGNDWIVFPWEE